MMLVLDQQIGYNIYKTALLFRRELIHCLKEFDLTPEQWQVLVTLWEKKVIIQSDIIEITLQDPPSVSRMVNRMLKKGLLKKEIHPKDKRAIYIHLTEKAELLKKCVPKKVLKHFSPIIDQVIPDEQEVFLRILKGFQKYLCE